MKNNPTKFSSESAANPLLKCFLLIALLGSSLNLTAQTENVVGIDFQPQINGFGFKNYRNEGDRWKDDVGADDLIRMFGAKAVCKTGDSEENCVMHTAAKQWMEEILEAMQIGHCEGIAVASLRMKAGLPFKKRTSPNDFQNGAKFPFNIQRNQLLENYISYFWITQTFKEVKDQTNLTARRGPVEIAKTLISTFTDKKDSYLINIFKYDKNNRIFDGHAVAPFAVEETERFYKIYVYDNSFPGETRYLFVNKNANQVWTYNSKADSAEKPDYVGDRSTLTLSLTATSWRENRCFKSPFAKNIVEKNCTVAQNFSGEPSFINASFRKNAQIGGETADFFLTGEGDMLVTDPNSKRIGYDTKTNRFYEEINGGNAELLIGGFGEDLPHYTVPHYEAEKPYKIVFSGKYLDEESELDFVFSAPGFTVGFDGILLDPNEILEATISTDGEQITFTSSNDSETPNVFFAFDPEDEENASYYTLIDGVELTAGKTLTMDFEFENGKLYFSDDDGNEDAYDITLVRVNADGTEQIYQQNDLNIGNADKYEMDFGDWDGEGEMCFKDDEDGDGFGDEECEEQSNEIPPDDDDN